MRAALLMVAVWPAVAAARGCPEGQSVTADTDGHCCFPSQVWAHSRHRCVGIPVCPAGMRADGESCVASAPACPPGQVAGADTAGHCCFPAQVWSTLRQACAGIPDCPDGLEPRGETCAARPACTPGQSVTAATAGHCCWSDQSWSADRQACVGAPRCPAGMVVRGEACATPAPLAPPATPATPATPAPPAPIDPWPAQPRPAPIEPWPTRPPPPVHQSVPVSFEAAHAGDRYQVSVGELACVTPCALELPPGPVRLRASAGAFAFSEGLRVPDSPARVRLAHLGRLGDYLGPALLAFGAADVALGSYLVGGLGDPFAHHGAIGGVCIAAGIVGVGLGIVEVALAGRHSAVLSTAPSPQATVYDDPGGGAR